VVRNKETQAGRGFPSLVTPRTVVTPRRTDNRTVEACSGALGAGVAHPKVLRTRLRDVYLGSGLQIAEDGEHSSVVSV
jgi:hypothetical protein